MANKHWENDNECDSQTLDDIENLSSDNIRLLHKMSRNFCASLMATDLIGLEAKNCTLSYAILYLCILDESFKVVHNCKEFKGWATTYTLLGIL